MACFIAEPVAGATLGAAVPPDDYWPAVAEVCGRHGVLLIADEVMTGFGRTGTWFGVRALGRAARHPHGRQGRVVRVLAARALRRSGEVYETVAAEGFVHGFTYSHHAVGAAVGRAVLARLRDGGLVEAQPRAGGAPAARSSRPR